ncbi:hippocampus abundant transcript 1 protein, partial [Hyalella azteca]|uniref:Hippocampus abundant transcript 1 protein n=1 Tax=Hyalella azteca TaxID=294128 RepID=A0A8B7NMG1_HYAAZ
MSDGLVDGNKGDFASKSCQTDRDISVKEVQTDSSLCQKECQTDETPDVSRAGKTMLSRGLSADACERTSDPKSNVARVSCHQRSCSSDYCLKRCHSKDSRQRRQQSSDFLYFVKKDPSLASNFPLNLRLDDTGELGWREHRRQFSAVEVVTADVIILGAASAQDPPLMVPSSPPDEAPPPSRGCSFSSGIGEASLYHALVVIFLEFFAWGLLTSPMIDVLNLTFPNHTFLMNGLIMGIKGILSFLSAPLIGALSDVWGRKFFLLVTVFFTCLPIPFMKINTWWYFALISMSGVFAVTFSIVFAYVADVTDKDERSYAYGLVSATFAASLVTSPALGAYLGSVHSDDLVVGVATAIAVLDVFFILVAVPESLPEKLRISSSWSAANISWENADPFS